MSRYYAQVDKNNVVTDVDVVTQTFIDENPDRYTGTWVETFAILVNKTYAGIGFIYNPITKDFVLPYEPPLVVNS